MARPSARGRRRASARVLSLVVLALAASAPAFAEVDYRTVVIFGDTQDLVTGREGGEEVLAAMVDWVLAHRASENIDFVLHVGDVIQRGHSLLDPTPPECFQGDACGRIPPFDRTRCRCRVYERTPLEWRTFDRHWAKLDGVIPYAIVRGNHDNKGLGDPERPGYRKGFAQYFGAERMARLPGYLESYPGGDDVAHAWLFNLGTEPVLVIGLSWHTSLSEKNQEVAHQLSWAERVLGRHPGIPAIILTHRFFYGVPVDHARPAPNWVRLVAAHPDRVFLAAWGHVSPGRVEVLRIDGHPLLRVRTDFQQHRSSYDAARQSYMNLVRFYFHPDGTDDVEVVAFSPLRGTHSLRAVRLRRERFQLRGRGGD